MHPFMFISFILIANSCYLFYMRKSLGRKIDNYFECLSGDLLLIGRNTSELSRQRDMSFLAEKLEECQKKSTESIFTKDDLRKFENDIVKLTELRNGFKEDRFKNIREAFRGTSPNEDS